MKTQKEWPMTSDQIMEAKYAQLVRTLACQLHQLEAIGENDLSILHYRLASRCRTITRNLRKLVNELSEDVCYPEEPLS